MSLESWEDRCLEEIAMPIRGMVDGPFGSNLPAAEYTNTGVPVIRGANLSLGKQRFHDADFIFVSEVTAQRLERSLCYPGDIIFTKKGTLGQIGIIPAKSRFPKYLLSSNQMKLSINVEIADKDFVYLYLSAKQQIEKIRREAEFTGVPKINLSYLKKIEISLPPLPTQRRIAAILTALDDKIELNRRMNETLEGIAQAVWGEWFGKYANGEEELPEGWRWGTMEDITDIKGGTTPSTKIPEYWDGEISWTSPRDLSNLRFPVLLKTEKRITKKGLEKISSGLLPEGTLLLSSRAPIGYLAITQIPVAINQGYIAINSINGFSNLFMLFWLKANMDKVIERANGSTFLEISKTNFRSIEVLIPPKEVHDRFGEIVSPVFKKLVENEVQSRILTALRDALLPRLMRGDLEV